MKTRRAAALTAICLTATGCTSTLKPALPMPMTFISLSTNVEGGKIKPPDPSRTVDLPANTILDVGVAEYPGFDWHADNAQNTSVLYASVAEGQDPCPTGTTGCVITEGEQYMPGKAGMTTITFTLVATGDSSLSPTAPGPLSMPTGGSACPAGITMPPPSADIGCVLGTVTLTVKVG